MAWYHAPGSMPPAARTFSQLSVDILAIIASFLSPRDMKASRLASRELNMFLSPYLFRSIRFTPYQPLDALETVSRHPDLSSAVKILLYEPTYKRVIAHDEFEVLEGRRNEDLDRYQRDKYQLRHVFIVENNNKRFQAMLENQVEAESKLQLHLTQIIRAFPKISTITLLDTTLRYISKSTRFPLVWRESKLPYRWIQPQQFLALIQAIIGANRCITAINTVGYLAQKKWAYLDNADFGDDSNIPGSIKYCLKDHFWDGTYEVEEKPFIPAIAFNLNTGDLNATKHIFSNLTYLNLGIFSLVPLEYFYISHEFVPPQYVKIPDSIIPLLSLLIRQSISSDVLLARPHLAVSYPFAPETFRKRKLLTLGFQWGNLPQVLQSLTGIVDLSLDFGVCRSIDQQHICVYHHDDLLELFEDLLVTCPRLKSLQLAQFRARGKSLNSLLQRHLHIENLRLKSIIAVTYPEILNTPYDFVDPPYSEWLEVLQTMRSMRLQRLELSCIEGFYFDFNRHGSENEDLRLSRIHDYILHGYGDNPLLADQDGVIGGNTTLEWDRELWW